VYVWALAKVAARKSAVIAASARNRKVLIRFILVSFEGLFRRLCVPGQNPGSPPISYIAVAELVKQWRPVGVAVGTQQLHDLPCRVLTEF
jgi:hypothetical protein